MRKVKREELPELIKMVSQAFQYKEGESVDRDFPLLYSANNINNLNLFFEDDKILAHAGRYALLLKIEGEEIPVSGIGGVCTDPTAQGKGYASQLVEKCLEEAKVQGSVLAFLWTDKPEFYQRMGFELVGRQWCIDLQAEAMQKLKDKTEIYSFQFSDQRDEKFFQQSFSFLKAQVLGVARSFSDHRILLSSTGCQVYSAWLDGELMAYMVLNKGRDLHGYIHEWAGESEALLWLLPQLVAPGARFLLTPHFSPEEAPWIYRLEDLGFPMEAQSMGMVKILSPDLLVPILKKRAPDFSLKKAMEDNSLSDLTQMLFGAEAGDELQPLRLWFWGMDSV